MADVKKIMDRHQAMRTKRSPMEQDWRDCLDMTFPVRAHGFSGQQVDSVNARSKNAARLDSTGTDSARNLAANIVSGTTPSNSRWFGIEVGNETDDERRWLDDAADTIWRNIHAANFDSAAFEITLDLVGAGWFVLFTDINREAGGGYSFEQWPIAECFIATTRQDGRPNIVHREYQITALQAEEEFGLENLSAKTQEKLRTNKGHELVKFVRCIEPRTMYAVEAKLSKNLPYASIDIEFDEKHVVREQGFHEFPCTIPRWTVVPGTVYAVGPVFDVLPDLLELNELVRMEKAAAALGIAGMWIAESDGILNPKAVTLGPNKIIVANSVDSMKELKSGADFNIAFTMKAELQAQIRRGLMADQLQPQDGPAMTATEVHVRVALIRQLLGPVYGRLQAEYLAPLVERCFGLALRAGALGRPPDSLVNRDFQVKYISPLARAQRLEDISAMDQLEGAILTKAREMPELELTDGYDFEEADRLRAQFLGVPSKLMRKPEDVKKIREERAEKIAKQQQAAQAAAGADAAMQNPETAPVMQAMMAA